MKPVAWYRSPRVSLRTALLLLLLGFALGAFVYFALQGGIPGLPTSPFAKGPERPSLAEDAAGAERRLIARYPQLRPKRRSPTSRELKIRLAEHDVRDLALAGLSRHPEGQRLLLLARALDVDIGGGEIGFELVFNLEQLPRELLTERERRKLEQVDGLLPTLGGDLPICIYGRPEAHLGKLRLGGRPRVELSILKLSMETVSERLGMTSAELEEALVLEWPGYELLDVKVGEGIIELVVRRA